MKQITFDNLSSVTQPPFIGPMKCYAFRLVTGSGFIRQANYRSGGFIALASDNLLVRNNWNSFNSGSLATCINKLLRSNAEVFEFQTPQKMFLWLSNQKS